MAAEARSDPGEHHQHRDTGLEQLALGEGLTPWMPLGAHHRAEAPDIRRHRRHRQLGRERKTTGRRSRRLVAQQSADLRTPESTNARRRPVAPTARQQIAGFFLRSSPRGQTGSVCRDHDRHGHDQRQHRARRRIRSVLARQRRSRLGAARTVLVISSCVATRPPFPSRAEQRNEEAAEVRGEPGRGCRPPVGVVAKRGGETDRARDSAERRAPTPSAAENVPARVVPSGVRRREGGRRREEGGGLEQLSAPSGPAWLFLASLYVFSPVRGTAIRDWRSAG